MESIRWLSTQCSEIQQDDTCNVGNEMLYDMTVVECWCISDEYAMAGKKKPQEREREREKATQRIAVV